MINFFLRRKHTSGPQTEAAISQPAWGGIVGLVNTLITTGAFGARYPRLCPEGHGPIGTDEKALSLAVLAEFPGFAWPPATTREVNQGFWIEKKPYVPEPRQVLALIEFCYRVVAKPIQGARHEDHYHLGFDEAAGKQMLVADINSIFSSNNLPYELNSSGRIVQAVATAGLEAGLLSAHFHTGNAPLDSMLEDACTLFLDPAPSARSESLRRLWDCWNHLKSLDNQTGNAPSLDSLITGATSDAAFLSVLQIEARTLTEIGHSFSLRQSEAPQSSDPAHVEYLFHRLYSMIRLLLSQHGSMA